MAARLKVQSGVPLPCRPVLAEAVGTGIDLCKEILGLEPGEAVNITNQTPDLGFVFVVAWIPGAPRRGWLPGNAVRLLSVAAPECQMPLREVIRHAAFVRVSEDWPDPHNPSTLNLRTGDTLQVSVVRDGWAFGWQVEAPSHRGWFPLSCTRKIDSTVASLAQAVQKQEVELSVSASTTLIELLKVMPKPPARQWHADITPEVVADSQRTVERRFQEACARLDAREAAAAVSRQEGAGTAGGGANSFVDFLAGSSLPEDTYPLFFCKDNFKPPAGTGSSLLHLRKGDLVRVKTKLDSGADMYFGFMDNQSSKKGWFPRKYVELLEDSSSPDIFMPLHMPPPPEVPEALRRSAI